SSPPNTDHKGQRQDLAPPQRGSRKPSLADRPIEISPRPVIPQAKYVGVGKLRYKYIEYVLRAAALREPFVDHDTPGIPCHLSFLPSGLRPPLFGLAECGLLCCEKPISPQW